jgi:hypothetical protein
MRLKKDTKLASPKLKRGGLWWVAMGVFVISVVVFTIETATSGAKLAKLEKLERQLSAENGELSSKLVELSSLRNLDGKSLELGFGLPQKIIYIGREDGFAKLP